MLGKTDYCGRWAPPVAGSLQNASHEHLSTSAYSIKELPSSCTLTKGKELLKLTTIQTRHERSCVPRLSLGYAADWCSSCLLFEHSTSPLEMPTCWFQRSLKYFFFCIRVSPRHDCRRVADTNISKSLLNDLFVILNIPRFQASYLDVLFILNHKHVCNISRYCCAKESSGRYYR